VGIDFDYFEEAIEHSGYCRFSSEDCKSLGITNETFDRAVKAIVNFYRDNPSSEPLKIPYTLYGEINEKSTAGVTEHILRCAAAGEEVFLEIHSKGGNIACLSAIASTLETTGVKLITIGGGQVASCAAALFFLGDRRALKDGSELLLHEGSTLPPDGKRQFLCDLEEAYVFLKESNERLVECYLKKTLLSREEFDARTKGGKDWIVTEDDYSFTTHTYKELAKEIIAARKRK